MNKRERFAKIAIETYTGRAVKCVHMAQDPNVRGTWALRAEMADGGEPDPVEFMIREWDGDTGMDPERLEECVFTVWPPKSGRMKFIV